VQNQPNNVLRGHILFASFFWIELWVGVKGLELWKRLFFGEFWVEFFWNFWLLFWFWFYSFIHLFNFCPCNLNHCWEVSPFGTWNKWVKVAYMSRVYVHLHWSFSTIKEKVWTLDRQFSKIIEPVLTLNQGSKKSKNHVKELTLNSWFIHENHQFFEIVVLGKLAWQ
jgi:hypothetical protein